MLEIYKKLEKYNFWHKEKINTGFLRLPYLEKINGYIGNDLIKVIVGQRRVGKSYILRQIIQELISKNVPPINIFYFNKELVAFEEVKTSKELVALIEFYKKKLGIKGKIYLLLDEIQEIDQWEKAVNSFSQDYKDQYEVFITGSNSSMLSGELATYLSGRYVTFEIFPFLFDEYISFFSLDRNRENYLRYLKTGGLPELFRLEDEEIKSHYVESLKDTILLKDIVKRYNIKDASLLESLFKFIVDNIGNIFSVKGVVDYLNSHKIKTNHETISNYIKHLQRSFLIHEAERFDIKGKTILSGNKKYYINDLSFRNYLSSGFDYGLGKHLENAIYLQYKSLGYKIYVGSIAGEEVDFILEKGQERKYLQVTYLLQEENNMDREFGSLEKIRDSYEKIIISLDDVSFGNRNGIKHLCAWEI